MKTLIDSLVQFDERWLTTPGWRRALVIILTVATYVAFFLIPSVEVIVMSGYSRAEKDNIEIVGLVDKFIEKPFTGERLVSTVRELL